MYLEYLPTSLQAKAYVTFYVCFFPIMFMFFFLALLHAKNNEIYAKIIKAYDFCQNPIDRT